MKIRDNLALSFDDCLLVPKHFGGNSRRTIDTKAKLAGMSLDFPILSANMPAVTGKKMCEKMAEHGGMGILHRSCTIQEQVEMIIPEKSGAAIGIGEDWQKRAKALIDAGAKILCIDVAHGSQDRVIEISRQFVQNFFGTPLIVGNIATPKLIDLFKSDNLLERSLDRIAFKCGVGGGSVCTTRIQTGCGVPTLQTIIDCAQIHPDVDLIADGGIKSAGDVVKSIAAGASAVMCGSLLAGCEESPGAILKDGRKLVKAYYGNASHGGKKDSRLKTDYVEGAETLVDFKGPVDNVLSQIKEGLQSGISYCGKLSLKELKGEGDFIRISTSGFRESMPHGLF